MRRRRRRRRPTKAESGLRVRGGVLGFAASQVGVLSSLDELHPLPTQETGNSAVSVCVSVSNVWVNNGRRWLKCLWLRESKSSPNLVLSEATETGQNKEDRTGQDRTTGLDWTGQDW